MGNSKYNIFPNFYDLSKKHDENRDISGHQNTSFLPSY